MNYPVCKKTDLVEDWFGTKLPDPHGWLRNGSDPEARAFVAAENAYTDAWFADKNVEAKIAELKAKKIPPMYMTFDPFGDGYVGSKMSDGGGYDIDMLDANFSVTGALANLPGMEDMEVFMAIPAPGRTDIIALEAQYLGAPRPTAVVYSLAEQRPLFKTDGTFYISWSKLTGCLYCALTESILETHECRSSWKSYNPSTNTEEVLVDSDKNYVVSFLEISSDGTWVLLGGAVDYAKTCWIALDLVSGTRYELNSLPEEWKYIDTLNDEHYFISMSQTACGCIVAVANDGSIRTILPEREGIFLNTGFSVGGKLFAIAHKDVSSCLVDVSNATLVELPSQLGHLDIAGRDDTRVFLTFESFAIAPRLLAFDGTTFTTLVSSSDKEYPDIIVEQLFAPSTGDGTPIPYYLVRSATTKPNGTAPALMYGYGGYNTDMPPWYTEMVSSMQIPDWIEKGGIYVHLNLRGGNEYGPAWHEAGMMLNKRHCYEDFIGVTEQVIRDGWTHAGNIGIVGCSNGGLLMSALVTMRPDLWGCVLDSVPHTDMIHMCNDDRGPMYITEYGNPHESKEIFDYLLSYSPYHNIREIAYPATYIQTGECDNNVPPYHGKKFAARMQEMTTGTAPVLLRVLAHGSHNRGGTPEEYWRTTAEMHTFLEEHLEGLLSC